MSHEDEVVRRWWVLSPGSLLPGNDGVTYQLLFAGHPGSATGPDVCDAIIAASAPRSSFVERKRAPHIRSQKYVGDVEFHVRSSDWGAHRHDGDPRYNNVILHVVLYCDDPNPTRRQDGSYVPVCSLADIVSVGSLPFTIVPRVWPCQQVMPHLSEAERWKLLRHGGLLRFEQKAHAFVEQLRTCDTYDVCLLPALTEGLGYGRDRSFFRAVGFYLLDKVEKGLPEPLGRSPSPSPLDVRRLHSLRLLVEERCSAGIWLTLRGLLQPTAQDHREVLRELRNLFSGVGLSIARADILVCNVILPFAAAVALLEKDIALFEQAQHLYSEHPGLPSNRITRMMCNQLQLYNEPVGSCQQQGLQYIYRQTCQEKRCDQCIAGKWSI